MDSKNLNLEGNPEIEKALKEFEEKAGPEEILEYPEPSEIKNTSTMVEWVMKWSKGKVDNPKKAEYVLLGFIILMFLASLYFFLIGSRPPNQISLLLIVQKIIVMISSLLALLF